MSQLLLDLRINKAFTWASVVLLHDESLDRDMVTKLIQSLSVTQGEITSSAISVLRLSLQNTAANRRREIVAQLKALPLQHVGENFLVIVNMELMSTILEISKTLDMTGPTTQWLYIISDMDGTHDNISAYTQHLGEGENIAFAYNATIDEESCVVQIKNSLGGNTVEENTVARL